MSARILLIEDEPGLVMTVTDLLEGEGHEVTSAQDGITGLDLALKNKYDIVVLDLMLPGKNGLDVCREIRQHGMDVAVLMLTAKAQVVDRVVGLKLGADDYLTKPFDPAELAARVEALNRRVKRENVNEVVRFAYAGVQVDFDRGEVIKNGEAVGLTGKELQLLRYFVEHRGRVVSREELLQHVWEYQSSVTSRTVDVHVAWLRQKLEDTPQVPRHFHTVRGVGYRFAP